LDWNRVSKLALDQLEWIVKEEVGFGITGMD
jgi:hypothetical protein